MTPGITRRDFLKNSAATLAAMSAGVAGSASAQRAEGDPRDLVRAGIIGPGSQGTMLLGQAVKIPGVKFVASCDVYQPHLDKSLVVAEGAQPYTDYRKLLERKDIQAVVIAVPLHLHSQVSIDAMDAGKDVFCEKMMAYSIEQARAMARKADETGRILQLGHQRRVNEIYNHAYRMINTDKVCGRITQVRAQWHRNGSWRRNIPDPSLEKHLNWRLYKATSQGLMAELGSHQIDIVNWFLNTRPLSVMAVGGLDYWKDGRDVLDNISVLYEYPDGVKCVYSSITTNQYEGYTEEFMGDQGTLIVSPDKGLLFREPQAESLVWSPMAHKDESKGKEAILLDAGATRRDAQTGKEEAIGAQGPKKNDYYVELEQFFDSVRTRKMPASNARNAFESCVSCLMANHSEATGRKIAFNNRMFTI